MITFDTFEQVDAEPLELIGADAGRHGRAGFVEIGIDLRFAQLPHRHAGNGNGLEQDLAIARNGNSRMKLMTVAGKGSQLICGLGATGGFGEKLLCQGQRLIRADDNSIGLTR